MRVLEEFFAQGDRERAAGLAVSPMMDRTATSTALSQMNFIEFIVAPLYNQVPGLRAGRSAVAPGRCRPCRPPRVPSHVTARHGGMPATLQLIGQCVQVEEQARRLRSVLREASVRLCWLAATCMLQP